MSDKKFFPAIATLVGTIVGAGFLGIPYVITKSGFLFGILLLFLVACFMLLMKLYLGEIALRTKGNHQMTGYAQKYLGSKGKIIMFFAMFFGIYSALTAYIIAEGKSLSFLVFGNFQHAFLLSILFWIILTFLTHIGLRALKTYEKISMVLVLTILSVICIFFIGKVNISNLNYSGTDLFAPFGLILFSFLAFSAIPEVKRVLWAKEKYLKKVIIYSFIISFAIYLLFTFIVVGVYGNSVNEIATLSLGRFFSILGILTMFTAFFAQSIAIRDMFRFDFALGRFKAWILSSVIPLFLFLVVTLFQLASFTTLLSLAGIVSGGLTGILVLIMNLKAKKYGNRNPEYSMKLNKFILLLMSLIFILAVVLELIFN